MSDPDGWILQVEPATEPGTDYLWIVSPPWQAAPHRYLGEGFGLTARQSLAMKRSLRFVTTRGAYQEAMAAYTAASRGPIEGIVERLAQLGQGSLSIEITGFDIAPASNGPIRDSGARSRVAATGVGAPFSLSTVTTASPVPRPVRSSSRSYAEFGNVFTVAFSAF